MAQFSIEAGLSVTSPVSWVPELVPGVKILELPLSALEGFVLSRIDGRAQVSEILAVTGLPPEQVTQILERLCALGAVRPKGQAKPVEAGPKPLVVPFAPLTQGRKLSRTSLGIAPTEVPPSFSIPVVPPTVIAPVVPAAFVEQPPRYPASELEEACDLPRERRRQVLDYFYRLSELDYYEALDIAYDAPKSQIRTAYFSLSKAFHPDTLFRKDLGSFKAKMETVFQFLTEGYDTLSKKKSREEYDAYLQATKATAMAERALSMAAKGNAGGVQSVEDVALPPPPPVPAEWGEVREARALPETPATAASDSTVSPREPATDEARKLAQEVVARRLRSAITSPLPSRESAPSVAPAGAARPSTDPQQALMGLGRALKESRAMTSGVGLLSHHVRSAQEAVARDDLRGAMEHLRSAMSLAPTRAEFKAEYESLSKKLSEKLAAEYIVQAQFEAKQGKWASSALAWAKVCEGRPDDAVAFRSAGFALFKVGGDLRSAQKYAQQAVFLAPTDLEARVVLAQIYLTLGLKLNAKRELDTALKLDPASEIVKNLLSDLKS